MARKIRLAMIDHVRSHRGAYIIVALFLICGVVLGSFTVNILNGQQKTELGQYINAYIHELLDGHILWQSPYMFSYYLWTNLRVGFILGILGLIVVGLPFALLYVGLRGFIIGFSAGFLVYEKGVVGAVFAAAAILPHHLVAIPGLLIAGAAATQFSSNLLYTRITKRPFLVSSELIRYSGVLIISLLWLTAAAVVETYVTPILIQFTLG